MKLTFNELLGLILIAGLTYLLAFRTVPDQVQGVFIAVLTLVVNYFYRKSKPGGPA